MAREHKMKKTRKNEIQNRKEPPMKRNLVNSKHRNAEPVELDERERG